VTLDQLLRAAEEADGLTRMNYRDPIAAFGAAAIERLAPWLLDAKLGGFAGRTIERAATQTNAADVARSVLRRAQGASAVVEGDIAEALATLAPTRRWAAPSQSTEMTEYQRGVVKGITFEIEYPDGSTKTARAESGFPATVNPRVVPRTLRLVSTTEQALDRIETGGHRERPGPCRDRLRRRRRHRRNCRNRNVGVVEALFGEGIALGSKTR
jgi:hypothetical protein